MTLGRKETFHGPRGLVPGSDPWMEQSDLRTNRGVWLPALLDGGHPGVQLTFHHLATQDKVPRFLGAHHLVAG